jgi:hypothetical protein
MLVLTACHLSSKTIPPTATHTSTTLAFEAGGDVSSFVTYTYARGSAGLFSSTTGILSVGTHTIVDLRVAGLIVVPADPTQPALCRIVSGGRVMDEALSHESRPAVCVWVVTP